MNGKEFIECIKSGKITDKEAAEIIDNMNKEANKMADNIKRLSHDWINGLRLTIEKGHICLINHINWPVWVQKIETMPEDGFNLSKILDKAWEDEGK